MSIRQNDLYSKCILAKKLKIPFNTIGPNIIKKIEATLIKKYEGKCILEGYIKTNSCKILSYSCGMIDEGNKVIMNILFECLVCLPCEGMLVDCIVKNITKAGIKAEINDEISPLIIFLARDHHHNNPMFSKVNEKDSINIKVVGKRFELNDNYISVLGEFINISKKQIEIGEKNIDPIVDRDLE